MKKTVYSFSLFMGLSVCVLAQTYTGTAWKTGGWNFGVDNDQNFAVENVIEAWQYDKGTYMALPTDFTNAVADFKAGDYAAGQIKTPANTADATCAAMGARLIWDAVNSVTVANGYRMAYLNKRKGDNTDRIALGTCPALIPGAAVLNGSDPALYANPAPFTMNDAYGRLSSNGSALRFSLTFAPGRYNLLFKGNGSQVVKFRLLQRSADNVLTEVYSGTVSATATANSYKKITGVTGGTTEHNMLAGYEKLVDHMRLYATGACVISQQTNTSAGGSGLLEFAIEGNYVAELISDGGSGAVGAFTFEYAGPYGVSVPKNTLKNAIVFESNHQIVVKLNNAGKSNIKVFNLAGTLMAEKASMDVEGTISTAGFAKGIYLVKIENGSNTELRKVQVLK